jgi:replicative DNA helicase
MNELETGLPANEGAEKTILGAVLLDNGAFYEAQEAGIEPDDFSLDSHRRIWQRMADLMDAQRAVDIQTLYAELAAHKEAATVGGMAYLAGLTEGLPRRPRILEYLRIVKDKSLARKIMLIASAGIARAADGQESAVSLAGDMQDQILTASAKVSSAGQEIRDVVLEDAHRFEKEANAPSGGILGASLFTSELSRVTAGLQENELCLVCARPGQGKTEAAVQTIIENARRGFRVHFQSLEMRKTQIVRRMKRYIARIPVSHMRDPRCLRPEERQALRMADEELLDLPIFIDDTHELTTSEYRSRAVLAAKRWKADLLVMDYAQLLLFPRARTAVELAQKQAETLRHIARDYCRTIALAQLRRCPPNDLNRFPDIEDIFGSSAFEQAAQMILLLHRTRENKEYTGEDFCFLAKMRELQIIRPLGIRANRWGGFEDVYAEPTHRPTWQEDRD